jgi:hypothetical protein
MTETTTKRRQRPSELASKSRPGRKSYKTDQVVIMLRQPGGATIEEMATQIGWSASSITRIVQWLLFCTRAGVREVSSKKRPDGTTVYRAA